GSGRTWSSRGTTKFPNQTPSRCATEESAYDIPNDSPSTTENDNRCAAGMSLPMRLLIPNEPAYRPQGHRSALPRTKLAVARVAQARHNEAALVEVIVNRGQMNRQIRMR